MLCTQLHILNDCTRGALRLRRMNVFGPFEPDLDHTSGGKWSGLSVNGFFSYSYEHECRLNLTGPLISPEMSGLFRVYLQQIANNVHFRSGSFYSKGVKEPDEQRCTD